MNLYIIKKHLQVVRATLRQKKKNNCRQSTGKKRLSHILGIREQVEVINNIAIKEDDDNNNDDEAWATKPSTLIKPNSPEPYYTSIT